jgi:hypothetical protein
MLPLSLKDVALCAIDSANIPLTSRALQLSMAHATFGDAAYITDEEISGPFRWIDSHGLGKKSAWDYNTYLIKSLSDCFKQPFILTIQWDGYVLDATKWDPQFLDYDYIGPRWPWHKDGLTIGCGGFALRSQKLCHALKDPCFEIPRQYVNEDDYIGRQARPLLERKYGIKFAPETVADRFAYERTNPDYPTFGFHGLFNMWRHVNDQDMVQMAPLITKNVMTKLEFLEILVAYFAQRRFAPLEALYQQVRTLQDDATLEKRLADATRNPPLAHDLIKLCQNNFLIKNQAA